MQYHDDLEALRSTDLFSEQIHGALVARLPSASEMPLIYIGSGGDVRAGLLVSRSSEIVMVDRVPFDTIRPGRLSGDVAQEMSELYEIGTIRRLGRLGYMNHDEVEPGREILHHLRTMGIEHPDVQIFDGGNAIVRFELNGKPVTVKYVCTELWAGSDGNFEEFMRNKVGIEGDYGLLVKAGLGLGESIVSRVRETEPAAHRSLPSYIVLDDPQTILREMQRQGIVDAQTAEDNLLPGYGVDVLQADNHSTRWGYIHDTKRGGARAAICIRGT